MNYWICLKLLLTLNTCHIGLSNISGEMLREQSTVQQQSDSISPEPAREIPAEQPTQVGERARHEVLPANREGDLTTSSIQAQRNERNLSQVNPADEGIYK